MKRLILSPFLCLLLVVMLPIQAKQDAKRDMENMSSKENKTWHQLSKFIHSLSSLDEDASSVLKRLHYAVQNDDIVSKDEFCNALEHAQAIIVENEDITDDQMHHISVAFNELVDAVMQDEALHMRDCASQCNDQDSLKIRKILCVLNKAIFCDIPVFRDKAIFLQRVEMRNGLDINGRLRVHGKAKIDKLDAKKAEISNLEVGKSAEVNNLDVGCDLTVGCNILMNNSTSAAVGNIVKAGVSFIQNFGTDNTFIGQDAGNFTMSGAGNTGVGALALSNNTTGLNNIAIGLQALQFNTDGSRNVAVGVQTLQSNTIGNENVAVGGGAMAFNTTGSSNSVFGRRTLLVNTTGNNNTALGYEAMTGNTTGSNNIAVGFNAGNNLTTGDNNIDIGNIGVAAESNTIRIGTIGTQTANFQAGIFGAGPITGAAVLVDATTGQLGTTPSSIRYKKDVEDMNDASAPILKLRPVTFKYKTDPTGAVQYGLIAEDVDKVMPDLVVRNSAGSIEAVKYHDITILLLNEFIRLLAHVEAIDDAVATMNDSIGLLNDRVSSLSTGDSRLEHLVKILESKLALMNDELELTNDQLQLMDDQVQGLNDQVQSLDGQVQSFDDQLASLSDEVQAMGDGVGSINHELHVLKNEVKFLDRHIALLSERVNVEDERLEVLEDRVTILEEVVFY
jgi:archaellum component FlaC